MNARGNLISGRERICEIKDGKGSCGEEFMDNGHYCVWCCQILEFRELLE